METHPLRQLYRRFWKDPAIIKARFGGPFFGAAELDSRMKAVT